jgi:uncharacterized DUF497 family protein
MLADRLGPHEGKAKRREARRAFCGCGFSAGRSAITVADNESEPTEARWVTLGADAQGRVLIIVYAYHGEDIRLISARPAEPRELKEYEAQE